ncbi:Pentatricopeptide repeat-containing protein, partial [Durusdinium trenchii]
MRPATARGGRGQSPQRDPELMSRVKELETAQKNEERQKKLAERKRVQELREAKKKLSRELQAAQRSLTKSEQEVNKLTGQLARTEQQAQQATVKKNREGEKHEEGIGRIRQKHGKVGGVLREKMANVGQARGRLAHVQFALSMLEKGVIIQVGEADQQPVEHTGPPQPVRRRRRSVGTGEAGEGGEEEYYEEGEALEGEEGETQSEGFTWNAEMREEFEQLKEDRH